MNNGLPVLIVIIVRRGNTQHNVWRVGDDDGRYIQPASTYVLTLICDIMFTPTSLRLRFLPQRGSSPPLLIIDLICNRQSMLISLGRPHPLLYARVVRAARMRIQLNRARTFIR